MLSDNNLINIAEWMIKHNTSVPLHDKYWLSVMTIKESLPFEDLPEHFESLSYFDIGSHIFEIRRVDHLINLRAYINKS